MKLLDRAFDKAVELSKPVKDLTEGLHACAEQMKNLVLSLSVVAQNQAVHHQMIQQMWHIQQVIFKKLSENGLDTSMPEIGKSKEDKKAKSN